MIYFWLFFHFLIVMKHSYLQKIAQSQHFFLLLLFFDILHPGQMNITCSCCSRSALTLFIRSWTFLVSSIP